MDLSETIVAAMIGAGATVATATFQLFMAFRSRKADSRPKRSNGIRSALAVFGLLLGAAVAGFAYSELRMEREREDTRAMEQRISDRLQALANGQFAQHRNNGANDATLLAAAGGSPVPARSEAMVHIAACRSQTLAYGNDPVGCDAANANRAALCASVPSQADVLDVQLFARADGASREWGQSRVSIDQEIGGARFVGSTFEVEQGADDRKAVCANFLQWNNERGHEARIVVVYTISPAIAVAKEPPPANPADRNFPEHAPDTDAAASRNSVASDIASPDLASGAAQATIDPALDVAQAVIATQP